MTREEAKEALLQGKKVRHRYYSSNEWIEYRNNQITTEEGYRHGTWHNEFWTKYQIWPDGWDIVS